MFSEIFGEDDLPEFKQLVDPSIHESDLDIVHMQAFRLWHIAV